MRCTGQPGSSSPRQPEGSRGVVCGVGHAATPLVGGSRAGRLAALRRPESLSGGDGLVSSAGDYHRLTPTQLRQLVTRHWCIDLHLT